MMTRKEARQLGTGLAFLSPWLVGFLVFTLLPMIWLFLSTIQTQASLLTLPTRLVPSEVPLGNYGEIFPKPIRRSVSSSPRCACRARGKKDCGTHYDRDGTLRASLMELLEL